MRRTILAASLVIAACEGPDEHDHPTLTTGKQLYEHHCAPCHQQGGDGAFLKGVPPVSGSTMDYRQMVEHIRGQSRQGDTRMPTFTAMSQQEAEKIAVYMRRAFPTP